MVLPFFLRLFRVERPHPGNIVPNPILFAHWINGHKGLWQLAIGFQLLGKSDVLFEVVDMFSLVIPEQIPDLIDTDSLHFLVA